MVEAGNNENEDMIFLVPPREGPEFDSKLRISPALALPEMSIGCSGSCAPVSNEAPILISLTSGECFSLHMRGGIPRLEDAYHVMALRVGEGEGEFW